VRANGDKDGSFPGGGEGREVPFLRQWAKNLFLRSRERERSGFKASKQGAPLVIIPARGSSAGNSVAGLEIIALLSPDFICFGEHLRFRPWKIRVFLKLEKKSNADDFLVQSSSSVRRGED
jgi:hypothetical protein